MQVKLTSRYISLYWSSGQTRVEGRELISSNLTRVHDSRPESWGVHWEFPAGQTSVNEMPSRQLTFFVFVWLGLQTAVLQVILLDMIFFPHQRLSRAIIHTSTNLPPLAMAPIESKHYSVIWFQIYYKWLSLVSLICRNFNVFSVFTSYVIRTKIVTIQ